MSQFTPVQRKWKKPEPSVRLSAWQKGVIKRNAGCTKRPLPMQLPVTLARALSLAPQVDDLKPRRVELCGNGSIRYIGGEPAAESHRYFFNLEERILAGPPVAEIDEYAA